MAIETQNGDYNLTSAATVYNKTAAADGEFAFEIRLGDGTKNLNTAAATLTITVTVGGQTVGGSSELVSKASTVLRAVVRTFPAYVVSGEAVTITVLSSNASDTDVDVTVTPRLAWSDVRQVAGTAQTAADLGVLPTRVPQIVSMAQVGGTGAYYVKALDNSGAAVAPAADTTELLTRLPDATPGAEGGLPTIAGAAAGTLYVSKSGNDGNDGRSWSSAFLTIGAATAAAGDGETIRVGPGTFAEAVSVGTLTGITVLGSGAATIISNTHATTPTVQLGIDCVLRRVMVSNPSTTTGACAIRTGDRGLVEDCLISAGARGIESYLPGVGNIGEAPTVRNCLIEAPETGVCSPSTTTELTVRDSRIRLTGWTTCSSVGIQAFGPATIEGTTVELSYSSTSLTEDGRAIDCRVGSQPVVIRGCTLRVTATHANGFAYGVHASSALVVIEGSDIATTAATPSRRYDIYAGTENVTVSGCQLDPTLIYGTIRESAKIGDEMDLVNAPNSTAVTAIQSGLASQASVDALGSPEQAGAAAAAVATLNNLSQADIRTAVGMSTANLDTQLNALPTADENADAVWNEATSGHATAGTAGKALTDILADTAAVSGGAGAITYTVTVNDGDGSPMDGVEVWVTTDAAGTNVAAGTLRTDAAGQVVFNLDAGTYYLWKQQTGYNATNPETITVS